MTEETRARRGPGRPKLWLLVAVGGPEKLPTRVEVLVCQVCGALVPVTGRELHSRWHMPTEWEPS